MQFFFFEIGNISTLELVLYTWLERAIKKEKKHLPKLL